MGRGGQVIESQMGQCQKDLVVDLTDVSYVDSVGETSTDLAGKRWRLLHGQGGLRCFAL